MSKPARPDLGPGGRSLWDAITTDHDLDASQLVQLTEACRMKDRLDEMDSVIQGKGVLNLMRFRVESLDGMVEDPNATITVKFDAVIERANATANAMKQLIAALRLPDEATGKRPQYRGPRGAQRPSAPGGAKVSSLDRARAAKSS